MHTQILVLPAVLLNLAAAGLIRHGRSPARYASCHSPKTSLTSTRPGLYARFPNSSSIDETALHTTSQALLPLQAAQTLSADGQLESIKPATGQVGSVPAFGSGPGAATSIESESQTASKSQSSTSSRRSPEKEYPTQSQAVANTQTSISVPLGTAPSSVQQSIAPASSFQSSTSQAVQTSAAASQKPSVAQSAKATAAAGTPSSDKSTTTTSVNTQQSSHSTLASPAVAGSQQSATASTTSGAENGNAAMALGFNSVFASMNPESPCDANNKNEAVACVNGQYAVCTNGKYTLAACPQGQQCFALPLSKDFQGITVQCASLKEASQRLGQNPASPAAATPSESATSSSSSATPSTTSPETSSSKTSFAGQQPTTASERSTKTTPTQLISQTASESQATKSSQHSTTSSDAPSPTTVKPEPAVSTSTAGSDDDPIIITPIPDNQVQSTLPPAKAIVSQSQPTAAITAAPSLPGAGLVTVYVTRTTTVSTCGVNF